MATNEPKPPRTVQQPSPNGTGESLHVHAFWFYSVVVALGIEEAATPVIRHFLSPPSFWAMSMEAFRLVVFLLVSVRLLLGAAVHFDEVRRDEVPGSYRFDFLSGFVHFLILFAWSFTVEVRDQEHSISPYLLLLFVVIGYDLLWILLCLGRTTDRVKGWAFVNTATIIVGLLFFLAAKAGGWGAAAEHYPVLIIVTLVSIVDLAEITSGRRYIIPKLASLMGFRVPPT